MLAKHFENLRQKPEHIRKRYALVYAGIGTLMVFGFWVTSWSIINPASQSKVAQNIAPEESPYAIMSQTISETGAIKDKMAGILEAGKYLFK